MLANAPARENFRSSELRRDPVCLLQILMRTLIHDADLRFRLVYRGSLWSLPRAFFANFGVG